MSAYEKKIFITLCIILTITIGGIGYAITGSLLWWITLIPILPLSLYDSERFSQKSSDHEKK